MYVVLAVLLCCVTGQITPDSYCEHHFPSTRVDDYPLKHTTVIIRHGDRSPLTSCWPNFPSWTCTLRHQERPSSYVGNRLYTKNFMNNRNVVPGNCMTGQLTEKGYGQEVKNGASLHNLYKKYFPATFDPTLIYARSTDVPRTFLSVEALLYGLYPPEPSTCNDPIIAINTMDNDKENMIPNDKECPRLNNQTALWHTSSQYKDYQKNVISPLEEDIFKVFGMKPGYGIGDMFDCVQASACHQHAFPPGFDQQLYNRIIAANLKSYVDESHFPVAGTPYTSVQMGMGGFIGDLINNIDSVVSGKTNQTLSIFSGHDVTVLPLLLAYNVWVDGHWPPYASMITIEVLAGPSGDLVRMYYNNNLLNIPYCKSNTCTYQQFRTYSNYLAAAAQFCP